MAKKPTPEETESRFWSKVNIPDDRNPDVCWEWTGSVFRHGYGRVHIQGKSVTASRFAWQVANDMEIPVGMCVCHSCDNPLCCNPTHLWLGTNAENAEDMQRKGRRAVGEKHGMSRFTDAQIQQVFELRATGLSQRRIGKAIGMSQTYVRLILEHKFRNK